MKLGIIVNTNDPESAWNALRLGNEALGGNHSNPMECQTVRRRILWQR